MLMPRIFPLLFALLCFANFAQSQIIWAEPVFPTAGQPVTIFYDATQGTGGLANCGCDVFLQTTDFVMNTNGFQKTILLNDPAMNAVVLGNFAVSASNVVPNFQHTGWWHDYFTGDSVNVENTSAPLNFAAG